MKYSIVFSSRTGNTRQLAEQIRSALGLEHLVYYGTADDKALEADRIYVGFWTDKGCCDEDTARFLAKLEDKEVFLFGTAGFGGMASYFEKILDRTQEKMNKSCRLMGSYMCQGKMPMSVRERYMKMKEADKPIPNLDMLIANFDAALSHPDEADLEGAKKAVLTK